jgi:hypothetical protein
MLVELSVMEQRYHAVMEVISGLRWPRWPVGTGVPLVDGWLGRYEREGLARFADHFRRPPISLVGRIGRPRH